MISIYVIENTHARLCVSVTKTNSKDIAEVVAAHCRAQGYIVNVAEEK